MDRLPALQDRYSVLSTFQIQPPAFLPDSHYEFAAPGLCRECSNHLASAFPFQKTEPLHTAIGNDSPCRFSACPISVVSKNETLPLQRLVSQRTSSPDRRTGKDGGSSSTRDKAL